MAQSFVFDTGRQEAHNFATCHHLSIEPFKEQLMIWTDQFSSNQLEDKSVFWAGCIDTYPTSVARGLHLCGRTRLGYLSGTETPWVLVGDVS
ncbi:hypothetical protein Hanom_Chr01g00008261 [Helianthus anomalus]